MGSSTVLRWSVCTSMCFIQELIYLINCLYCCTHLLIAYYCSSVLIEQYIMIYSVSKSAMKIYQLYYHKKLVSIHESCIGSFLLQNDNTFKKIYIFKSDHYNWLKCLLQNGTNNLNE